MAAVTTTLFSTHEVMNARHYVALEEDIVPKESQEKYKKFFSWVNNAVAEISGSNPDLNEILSARQCIKEVAITKQSADRLDQHFHQLTSYIIFTTSNVGAKIKQGTIFLSIIVLISCVALRYFAGMDPTTSLIAGAICLVLGACLLSLISYRTRFDPKHCRKILGAINDECDAIEDAVLKKLYDEASTFYHRTDKSTVYVVVITSPDGGKGDSYQLHYVGDKIGFETTSDASSSDLIINIASEAIQHDES